MLDRRAWSRVSRLLSWVIFSAVLLLWSSPAQAYPWMIRHEYQGCVPCHADPSGAGLLTEYGRAQGDIILRMRYGVAPQDEASPTARFLWAVPTPEWLLLGGSVRNGYLIQKSPDADAETRFLQMQADVRAQVTFDRFRAYGSLGYMNEGARTTQLTHGDENNLVSRDHWLGVDLGEDNQYLLRAGRMSIPFGIRGNEHNMFVRSTQVNRTNINETQQHGVSLAYNGLTVRGEIMGILGNYQLNPDTFRERGYAGYLEFSLAPWASAGVSSMLTYAESDYVYLTKNTVRQAHGAFARLAPFTELVVMAEADAIINIADDAKGEAVTSPGFAGMIQADYEPIQGLHLMATGETWIADQQQATLKSFAGWGSVVWFFAPHADLRFDFVATSLLESPVSYTLLPQLHVYL